MGILDRYKKGGNVAELVKLIESSGEPKRTQLLQMIRNEDAEFAAMIEGKLFSYDGLRALPEGILAEIIAASIPKVVACAIWGESPDFIKMAERCLGKGYNDYKSEKETLEANPPTPAQIEAARKKIVMEARKLEAAGTIKLGGGGAPGVGGAPGTSSAAAAAVQGMAAGAATAGAPGFANGAAKAEDPCPPIETFGIEEPPPGLMGERFETFVKTSLGIK